MKILILIFIAFKLFASDYSQMKKAFDNDRLNRAIAYARNSATSGNVNAMYDLGLLYYSKGSISKAQRWFKSSINQGGKGRLGVALILFSQSKTKTDYENVLKNLADAEASTISNTLLDVVEDLLKKQNNASAQSYLTLAELFSNDKLVHPNNNIAFFLLKKAAQKNNPKALEIIGDAYNTLEKSKITAPRIQNTLIIAMDYYKKAYKLGNYDAMAKLGRLKLIGPRHIRRIAQAKELIKTSANKGSKIGEEIVENNYKIRILKTKAEKESKKSYNILFKKF